MVNTFSGGGAGAATMEVLPVNIVQFDAKGEKDRVALTWSTATEVNTKLFEVQRSLDGRNFQPLAQVKAAGSSNQLRGYSFDDKQVMQYGGQLIYYRLLQKDNDGQQRYSDVRSVRIAKGGNLLSLQFNPVRSEAVLNYISQQEGKISIRVADVAGRTIMLMQQTTVAGRQSIPDSNRQPGTGYLHSRSINAFRTACGADGQGVANHCFSQPGGFIFSSGLLAAAFL